MPLPGETVAEKYSDDIEDYEREEVRKQDPDAYDDPHYQMLCDAHDDNVKMAKQEFEKKWNEYGGYIPMKKLDI